jgi:hypothetical protein
MLCEKAKNPGTVILSAILAAAKRQARMKPKDHEAVLTTIPLGICSRGIRDVVITASDAQFASQIKALDISYGVPALPFLPEPHSARPEHLKLYC